MFWDLIWKILLLLFKLIWQTFFSSIISSAFEGKTHEVRDHKLFFQQVLSNSSFIHLVMELNSCLLE